jgi:dienelactone hydrolase
MRKAANGWFIFQVRQLPCLSPSGLVIDARFSEDNLNSPSLKWFRTLKRARADRDPDFFEGDPMKVKIADLLIPVDETKQSVLGKYTGLLAQAPSLLLWMNRHKEERTNKVCMEFLAALRRATPKSQKIGMVGFCWGGKYAIRAGLEENMIEVEGAKVPLVDAAVALHPSHLVVPQDVEALVVPVSYGWGLEDSQVKFEQKGQVEEIYAQTSKGGRKVPQMEHKVREIQINSMSHFL